MRDALDRLLRDVTLLTLAFAVAAGWSLHQLAHGIATFVDLLLTRVPGGSSTYFPAFSGFGLTWVVRHRVVSLDGIVMGAIELAVVLLAAFWVARRRPA